MVSYDLLDLTPADYTLIQDSPDKTVSTGFDGSEAATELQIFYRNGETIVVPCGEYQNAEPWKFNGKLTARQVRAEYRKGMKEAE